MRWLICSLFSLMLLLPVPSWGAIAFVQGKDASGAASPLQVTWTGNPATGNLITCGVTIATVAGATVTSITDSQSNVYVISSVVEKPTNIFVYQAYAKNITGGTTPTVSATVTGVFTGGDISCAEFSGVDKIDALHKSNRNSQTNPGTGTDAITSGTMATQIPDAVIVGFTCCAPSAVGTSFTIVDAAPSGGTWGEYRIVSATGTYAATFTTASATDDFGTQAMIFRQQATCAGSRLLLGIGGC